MCTQLAQNVAFEIKLPKKSANNFKAIKKSDGIQI